VTIIVMQVFVSLLLVGGSLVLFLHTVRQRDFDHADRLSLAPLEDDAAPNPKDDETA
jgi:cbb3-type cytochrome oxidase maturation protein